jgi:hypothetical protein
VSAPLLLHARQLVHAQRGESTAGSITRCLTLLLPLTVGQSQVAEACDCVHGQVHCVELYVGQIVQQVSRQRQVGVLGAGDLRMHRYVIRQHGRQLTCPGCPALCLPLPSFPQSLSGLKSHRDQQTDMRDVRIM